jgi:hypothetical protein
MPSTTVSENKTRIHFCPYTVEHPFDTNFAPAQPDSDWVRVADAEEEEYAWLLCSYSEHEWLVWLPSQGEAILHNNQLCRLRVA